MRPLETDTRFNFSASTRHWPCAILVYLLGGLGPGLGYPIASGNISGLMAGVIVGLGLYLSLYSLYLCFWLYIKPGLSCYVGVFIGV